MRFIKPVKGGGGVDTSDATAIADNILMDRTAYARGEKLTGTMGLHEDAAETTIQPGESFQIIMGYHTGGVVKAAETVVNLPSNYFQFSISTDAINNFSVPDNTYVFCDTHSSKGYYCFFAIIKNGELTVNHTSSSRMNVTYNNGILSIKGNVSGTSDVCFYSSGNVTEQ